MLKTYTGSCHCKAVRFEVDLDLSEGTTRCNCTICMKTRNWSRIVKPDQLRLLTPEDALIAYSPGPHMHQVFCRTCGVRPFARGFVAEIGGAFASVQVATLDDASPEELLSGPIQYCDGINNLWWNTPAEVRHL